MHQNYLTSSGTATAAIATQAVSVVDLLTIQANMNTLAGLIWGAVVGMLIKWRQGGRCERALEKVRHKVGRTRAESTRCYEHFADFATSPLLKRFRNTPPPPPSTALKCS